MLGTAGTLSVTSGGNGPNIGINVSATGATAQSFTFARNIDSTAISDLTGRANVRYANGTVGASGTLTVSGNWALAASVSRNYGRVQSLELPHHGFGSTISVQATVLFV